MGSQMPRRTTTGERDTSPPPLSTTMGPLPRALIAVRFEVEGVDRAGLKLSRSPRATPASPPQGVCPEPLSKSSALWAWVGDASCCHSPLQAGPCRTPSPPGAVAGGSPLPWACSSRGPAAAQKVSAASSPLPLGHLDAQ